MKDIAAIILAAGRGTRMKSKAPKVMHELLGKPVLLHLLEALKGAGVNDIIAVTGYGADLLKGVLKGMRMVGQGELLGSGDAVLKARQALKDYGGNILIVCGDTPLITSQTINSVMEKHESSAAAATLLTAELKDPTGYGRIIRNDDDKIAKIVEEDEAALFEEVIEEVNAGVYCFKAKDLFDALAMIKPDNKKKEYYLTDTIAILHKSAKKIESVAIADTDEMIGINTRVDLAKASAILKTKILERHMFSGVTIQDVSTTTIYPGVEIGRDSVILPNTVIEQDVRIGEESVIGPFAHLRPGVVIGSRVEIGNFVELVRTTVGDDSRVKHHAYLGDTIVGKNVNVGAGTITANYDGKNKNRTVIEDGAFIGVNSVLIAPVKIGKLATVGAGCVVPKNHDVPKGATVVGVPARVLKRLHKVT